MDAVSKNNSMASFRFVFASSIVLPWLATSISGQKETYMSSSFSIITVGFFVSMFVLYTDFRCSHARNVIDFYEFAKEALRPYEKLSRFVHFVLPDTQGPFDLACLIWGTDIFVAMHDEPELVSSLIRLMTDTYIEYNKAVKTITGETAESMPCISATRICMTYRRSARGLLKTTKAAVV